MWETRGHIWYKRTWLAGLVAVIGTILTGCVDSVIRPISPVAAGLHTNYLRDITAEVEVQKNYTQNELIQIAAEVFEERSRYRPERNRAVLCLSGGGAYGAYSAGVLYGWTQTGERPEFDVVTGVSTGALISPFAFLGPRYDDQLKTFYTTLHNDDLFMTRGLRGLFAEGYADNGPLARKIDETITPTLMDEIAREHERGRRLYVGTTEVEGSRFVVWDIGAIAARRTNEDLHLIRRVLLASAAVPGFFPPTRIPVVVDGEEYVERHVDGGVCHSVFFRPPLLTPQEREQLGSRALAGTDVYVIVAGKYFPDPQPLSPNALTIALRSISNILYAQARGDLIQICSKCLLTGMNYRSTAIPADFPAPLDSNRYDPETMTAMFKEGIRVIQSGQAWRFTPPGFHASERDLERASNVLSFQPDAESRDAQAPDDQAAPVRWSFAEPQDHGQDQHDRSGHDPVPTPAGYPTTLPTVDPLPLGHRCLDP